MQTSRPGDPTESRRTRTIVVVPPVPALLPAYASQIDPVPALRAACTEALRSLAETRGAPVRVVGEKQDLPVADHLLAAAGHTGMVERCALPRVGAVDTGQATARAASLLDTTMPVVLLANGSARRTERAPGHLDPRAAPFDAELGEALVAGDRDALAGLDLSRAEELLCSGAVGLRALGEVAGEPTVRLHHEEATHGVQYWVLTWTLRSA